MKTTKWKVPLPEAISLWNERENNKISEMFYFSGITISNLFLVFIWKQPSFGPCTRKFDQKESDGFTSDENEGGGSGEREKKSDTAPGCRKELRCFTDRKKESSITNKSIQEPVHLNRRLGWQAKYWEHIFLNCFQRWELIYWQYI